MYAIGDTAFYGSNGICTVKAIQEEKFHGESQLYYILESTLYPAMTLYHPVHCENSKLKKIVAPELAQEILDVFKQPAGEWNERNTVRMQIFRTTVESGEHLKIAELLNTMLRKQQELKQIDKKLYQQDIQMAQKISSILYDEIALSLEITKDEVADRVNAIIKKYN